MYNIERFRKLIHEVWRKAIIQSNRVDSGKKRLQKFPLLSRILFYNRFSGIRQIIRARQNHRFDMVFLALSLAKKLTRIEKAIRKGERL
jgi:hypothetical protein